MQQLAKRWLAGLFVKSDKKTTKNHVINSPVWQDMGAIYYVLSTLKLRLCSPSAEVTMEQLSAQTAHDVITRFNARNQPALPFIPFAERVTEVEVSVCGVGYEACQKQRRYKAINEAAKLELFTCGNCSSRATFKHQLLACDDKSLPMSLQNGDLHKVHNLSLWQFLHQLDLANKRLLQQGYPQPPVKADNFQRVFSNHEHGEISQCVL